VKRQRVVYFISSEAQCRSKRPLKSLHVNIGVGSLIVSVGLNRRRLYAIIAYLSTDNNEVVISTSTAAASATAQASRRSSRGRQWCSIHLASRSN